MEPLLQCSSKQYREPWNRLAKWQLRSLAGNRRRPPHLSQLLVSDCRF